MGAVETECTGLDLRQAGVALSACELLGEDQRLTALYVGFDHALAFAEGCFHGFGHPAHFNVGSNDQTVNDQFDVVPLFPVQVQVAHILQHENLAVNPDPDESRLAGGLENVPVLAFLAADLGRHQRDTAAFFQAHDGVDDLGDGLPLDGTAALGAVGQAHSGEQQTEIVVDLGYRAHSGTWVMRNTFLVDGDGRRKAFDIVDVRLVHPAQELPGVG